MGVEREDEDLRMARYERMLNKEASGCTFESRSLLGRPTLSHATHRQLHDGTESHRRVRGNRGVRISDLKI